ncbi:hypothetical protein B0O99DRAFT_674095 [Bisporella sp. PMI_857]|nr:hypothetical protein B0O99DRAFT_674095 [Bisporella sp. PMI_857]
MEPNLDHVVTTTQAIDEESGSAYEAPSSDEHSHGESEDDDFAPISKAASRVARSDEKGRGNGRNRSNGPSGKIKGEEFQDEELSDSKSIDSDESARRHEEDEQIRADAARWAANFQEPQSPSDIKSPRRKPAGSRQSKRKSTQPPSEVRAKRLKSFYSNDYRELLNKEISDAVTRAIPEDQVPLQFSQIGSIIWTAEEKGLFFTALARLGRDNIPGIAHHIRSKSQLEVQEYIFVLHEALIKRLEKRIRSELLDFVDFPAAVEVSDECSGVLERAGDALTSREECWEIEREKAKWDDESWLLTQKVSKWIGRQRRDAKEEAEIEASFPAAIFFDLKNWLELSRQVFMNPGAPHEEENWENLAEAGETPAIRATALQDFHSLAASITKRLVSTTLFCTLSRQRSKKSKLLKHSSVNPADVAAAVKILGLEPNSHDFWVRCARRCNLKVIRDEDIPEAMPYDEVELALGEKGSTSQDNPLIDQIEHGNDTSSTAETDPEEPAGSSSEPDPPSPDDDPFSSDAPSARDSETGTTHPNARLSRAMENRVEKRRAAELAQETYTEALDAEASREEELRLWALLRQDPPFEVGTVDVPDRPRFVRDEGEASADWRRNTEYWSQWETLETPVPDEDFVRNREIMERRKRRKALYEAYRASEGSASGSDGGEDQDEEESSSVGFGEAGNEAHEAIEGAIQESSEEEDDAEEQGIAESNSPIRMSESP